MREASRRNLLYGAGAGVVAFLALRYGPAAVQYFKKSSRLARQESKKGASVLIYDADCPACRKSIDWIAEHADQDAIEMLPCQSPETRTRFSIPEDVCMQYMMMVMPDGRVLKGAQTLPAIASRLRFYRPFMYFFKLPGMMVLSRWFYHWFTVHRGRISKVLFPREA